MELLGNVTWCRAHEDGDVEEATLANPPSVSGAAACRRALAEAFQLHECLGGVNPEEARGNARFAASALVHSPEDWDGAVQCHWLVDLVLKDVEVEETIRLLVEGQARLRGVLGKPEETWHVALERDVHAERCGASRLPIRVAAEVLLPKTRRIQVVWVSRRVDDHVICARQRSHGVRWPHRLRLAVSLEVEEVPRVETLNEAAVHRHVHRQRGMLQHRGHRGTRTRLEFDLKSRI
mmetsp:Transcript_10526/g.27888  ORF Transcript_10526/g.27888 Transcript_10526/m.27888 type:complete len:236 (-) Transcript_10526:514-1221(-)